MVQEMAPSGEPGGEDLLKRAFETHSQDAVGFLILAKSNLGDEAYKQLIKKVHEIVKRSSCTEGGITVKECEEILSEVFVGQTHVLKGFQHLLEGRDPFHEHDSPQDFEGVCSFLVNVKRSCLSNEDYNDLLSALSEATVTKNVQVEDIYAKVKRAMHQCPEFIETFATYLPDHLRTPPPNEQSCRSPKTTGTGESLHAEEHEGDKTDPLPDWSPSRENELPPKVNLDMCTRYTTSYYLLPKNCLTLKSSYRTKLGQSIFNDKLVSATSGREDCFKFRTKNHCEENIFKCEDDMFESDMLLQHYKATADFIENLQDHVDSDMKIQEHLTPLHRRCIEQLYDEHGLDMLDALCEKIDTSTVLAILHSRLNQKIEDLSEARLSLIKSCSNIIANNYHRSLDHRSSSFKQLDKRRISPKALIAEAREINMARLTNQHRHLFSACNKESSLIPENASEDTNIHIHKDIERMICCASKSCPSQQNPMLVWTKLVLPFVSINCQLPELNDTVAPKEACEHCGFSKTFLRSIPGSSFTDNFPSSSKRGRYLVNMSNKPASTHDDCQMDIEEGEFIPDGGNIQLGPRLGSGNTAENYDVAAPSEDGDQSEAHHESREGNVEMGNLVYSKRIDELGDVKGVIPCCSLIVLLRLHQILYERLLLAKDLSRESRTCGVYAGFKEELFNLLTGSTNSSNFEKYCLTFLGPKSYVLFTLHEVIGRVIKQYPASPTNGSLEQDHHEEGEEGSKPLDDTVKPMQNHFQRRKKRKLEMGAASISQPGTDGLNS